MALLLVTLDSAIFRTPEQYCLTVQLGSEQQKTASKQKTTSPLLNRDCFSFNPPQDPKTTLQVTASRFMGSSMDFVGKSAPIAIG